MKRFKLICTDSSPVHTKFMLFDPVHASCGLITIRTEDVHDFIARENWNGTIEWDNKWKPKPE